MKRGDPLSEEHKAKLLAAARKWREENALHLEKRSRITAAKKSRDKRGRFLKITKGSA